MPELGPKNYLIGQDIEEYGHVLKAVYIKWFNQQFKTECPDKKRKKLMNK